MLLMAGIIILVFSAQASAQTAIVVMDFNKVVNECKAGQRAKADIKQRFERLNAEIAKMGEELQSMQQEYQKQAPMMNESAKLKRQQELEAKLQVFNQRRMQAQQEIAEAERDALSPIMTNLKVIIDSMAKNKYQLILDTRNIPYYSPSIDITSDVIKAYDRAHP